MAAHRRCRRRALSFLPVGPRDQPVDLLADAIEVRTELHQDLRGGTILVADKAEQDVLGPDVVMTAPREWRS